MRKAAIILIVLAILVVIGANLFISESEVELTRTADNTTIRMTTAGEVVGFIDRLGTRAWQGIAYARPPTENNRWRAPQPPLPHGNRYSALDTGPACPQYASLLSGASPEVSSESGTAIAGDEDCLYLNIWSPPNAAGLPVMVWLHGGGNTAGQGGNYNGASLASSRNVVVVTLNYRLGVFGWFSHPALQTGDLLDDSGNYGTLDIIQALSWVRENIRAFGGNPKNVTVFGESAGASNVLTLMASPLAKGLFHRAISQSGGFYLHAMQAAQAFAADGGHRASSAELVNKLILADNLATTEEAARAYQQQMSTPRLREYLYSKSVSQLFAQLPAAVFGMVNLPTRFGDGHVLPMATAEAVFSDPSRHNPVPVILGTNRDEDATFMVGDPAHVETWFGFLPRLKDPQAYQQLVYYRSLARKESGVDSLATYMHRAGNPRVFAYRFDWDELTSPGGFDLATALGAGHGMEIPFVFNDFNTLGLAGLFPDSPEQFDLAAAITSYWTNFAHHGDPASGSEGNLPVWHAWGTGNGHTLLLDNPADPGIRMDDGIVTLRGIKAELAGDTTFAQAETQCKAYAQSFFGDNFDQGEYVQLNPVCPDLDPKDLSPF